MKRLICLMSAIVLVISVSCKKSTDGNKSVIVENNESISPSDSGISSLTERYVAEDGSSALVTFLKGDREKTISVKSNNKIISAPQKSETEEGGIYENYDFQIVAKKDSVIITQGNNVINLKKARGQ